MRKGPATGGTRTAVVRVGIPGQHLDEFTNAHSKIRTVRRGKPAGRV
jgi:hypothetical protein